jgi:transmembrane sensor
VANDRTVADIVDELRRYHRGTIVIADGGLARERTTGVYKLGDPAKALRAVASAHGATVRQISPWLVVLSR